MDEFLLWVDIEIKLELADHRSMKTLDRTICVDLILISWVLSLDIIPNSAKMILDGIETGNIVDWGLNGAEDVTDANITGNDVLDVDWVLHFDDLGLARGTNNRIGWFTLGFFGKWAFSKLGGFPPPKRPFLFVISIINSDVYITFIRLRDMGLVDLV